MWERVRKVDGGQVFNEGLLDLLFLNDREHHFELCVSLYSLDLAILLLRVGEKEKRERSAIGELCFVPDLTIIA